MSHGIFPMAGYEGDGDLMEAHRLIEEWCGRYGPDPSAITEGFSEQSGTLGLTYNLWLGGRRVTDIRLNMKLQGHDWMVLPTLWHEYCHAESWLLHGRQDGHNLRWLWRLWRRPWLAFLDTIVVQIAWLFVKRTR